MFFILKKAKVPVRRPPSPGTGTRPGGWETLFYGIAFRTNDEKKVIGLRMRLHVSWGVRDDWWKFNFKCQLLDYFLSILLRPWTRILAKKDSLLVKALLTFLNILALIFAHSVEKMVQNWQTGNKLIPSYERLPLKSCTQLRTCLFWDWLKIWSQSFSPQKPTWIEKFKRPIIS